MERVSNMMIDIKMTFGIRAIVWRYLNETDAQRLGRMIKYLRLITGMKREEFANYLHIPLNTVRDWEQGKRKMPEYVYELIEYKVSRELISKDEGDANGK